MHIPKNGEEGLKGTIRNRDIYDAYPHPDKPIDITVKVKISKIYLNTVMRILILISDN